MPCADKARLLRNFSRHAHLYDQYANVQRQVADALAAALPGGERKSVFEIGCGTGYYTGLLRKKYPSARLTACDFSERMIEVARQKTKDAETRRRGDAESENDINFIVADAETLVLDERFDLISSNATLQWLDDLPAMLKNCRAALTEGGVLAFSIFGPETFCELDRCLGLALGGADKGGVRARAFPAKDRIADMLRASFSQVDADERTIREEYPSLRDLLAKIKYTGARGDGLAAGPLVRAALRERVEKVFESEFGRVQATYQVFLFRAEP